MTFADIVETPKGYDCHVRVADGGREFVAVLPHEFPSNSQGVMRRPHVEKFAGYDFYLAPLALEQPTGPEPPVLTLGKGESATVDKYTITFHDFEMSSHGEGGATEAGAAVTIAFDGIEEKVMPLLRASGDDLETFAAAFDEDRGRVQIAGIRAETGAVVLQVQGAFLTGTAAGAAPMLVVELSEKPLINLFWLGTILVFGSGLLSMRERRRRRAKAAVTDVRPLSTASGGELVSS